MSILADANKMSIRQKNWPRKCICNLCICGTHTCSTYHVLIEREGANKIAIDNRCANNVPNERRQNLEMVKEVDQGPIEVGQEADDAEADDSDAQSDEITSCRCLGIVGERYLTSLPKARTKFSSPEEMKTFEDNQGRLHVLVTKPQIASKPRDNIVFEGDMDLRTTFETSYEALAKMRLDHWKQYQEQCGGIVATALTRAKADRSNSKNSKKSRRTSKGSQGISSANVSQIQANRNIRESQHQQYEQQKQDVSVIPKNRPSEQTKEGDVGSEPPSLMRTEETEQHLSAMGCDNKETLRVGDTGDTSSERRATPQAEMQQQNSNNHLQRKNYSKNIDPDLSPIIVYNANMNRLDKVGMRKRSKYRPSTSLRSGARGLFGDQDEGVTYTSRIEPNSMDGERAILIPKALSPQNQMAMTTTTTSSKQSPELNAKTELSLNARNLKNSNQAVYLTYSDHNLPVDSKRKVRDNINMVDHIKEQNIVEISTKSREMESSLKENSNRIETDHHEQEPMAFREDDLNNLKLAQQEEAALVEEIQRCTSLGQELQLEANDRTSDFDENGRAYKDLRQSRLQRTCQNQNFNISDNDYELQSDKLKLDGIPTTSRRESPIYNNLFRESPSFILTTGKFLDEESRRKSEEVNSLYT